MQINSDILENKKNLLAFSAGVDSTALFFILVEQNIPFDIAIVNYNQREQSKDEVTYANELAIKYNKKCYVKDVQLASGNFEKNARDIRYNFFEELISIHNYSNLITAHQLNDRLEWFLMQFTKGAGLFELAGLQEVSKKDNYNLIRPILDYSKDELLEYLSVNNIKYFVDESNFEDIYKRNYFRKNFSDKLLDEFQSGIKKSFSYLNKDMHSLDIKDEALIFLNDLEIFKSYRDNNLNIRIIDKSLKKRGYILSSLQRDEILKQKEIVIDRFSISIYKDYIWITPNSSTIMDKKFKELCRLNNIPKKNRAYLKEKNIEIANLVKNLAF